MLVQVCQDWDVRVNEYRKRRRLDAAGTSKSLMMNEGSQVLVNLQTVNYILHGIQHFQVKKHCPISSVLVFY